MLANKKFKDSVFKSLFSNPDLLRELYCALEGVSLPPDVPVTINTLKGVLFKERLNDISFLIGGRLVVMLEHQSTISENMALRMLQYITRIYDTIIKAKNIYTKKKVILPRPEFFVLYNGTAPFPDEEIHKLSDAFESVGSLGLPLKETPAMELVVRVININEGRNEAIAQRCKALAEYSAFIGKVREYMKAGMEIEAAMKLAVEYCLEHDIIKEFLESNATEVINMLMTEWDWDKALATYYEEGKEDGIVQGREEGIEQGREKGREQIARNALAEGASIEFIQKITGLSPEAIASL
jgi:predicted transposase/invertase (TIGR01784 family)